MLNLAYQNFYETENKGLMSRRLITVVAVECEKSPSIKHCAGLFEKFDDAISQHYRRLLFRTFCLSGGQKGLNDSNREKPKDSLLK